jgi:hypothetical protein
MKQTIWYLLRKSGLAPLLLRLHPKSGLRRLGWFRSFRVKRSIDSAGNPVPWWTYSFIAFIDERLSASLRVLEFGSGGSTLWLAKRVESVVSYESDPHWAAITAMEAPSNVRIVSCASLETAAANLANEPDTYDIIVIDAGNRIEIASIVLSKTSIGGGCIIWDNTDGPDWPQIRALMAAYGFRELSFVGLVPQEVQLSRTSLFYRTVNVLGI